MVSLFVYVYIGTPWDQTSIGRLPDYTMKSYGVTFSGVQEVSCTREVALFYRLVLPCCTFYVGTPRGLLRCGWMTTGSITTKPGAQPRGGTMASKQWLWGVSFFFFFFGGGGGGGGGGGCLRKLAMHE